MVQVSQEPEAFLAFERDGWNTVIGGYERVFGPLTAQTVAPLLDAAGVTAGGRVLDLCTGHGVMAAAAAARGAVVEGLDFAEDAVAAARRNVPAVTFRQGDAQALPHGDASFDAALCAYGVMHVPDPARVLAEMRRVLRPGGRAAVSVWERPAAGNGYGLLFDSIRAHGRTDVPLPHGPDFFQFGDAEAMAAALRGAGFTDIRVTPVPQLWHFAAPGEMLDAILAGAVRSRALLQAQAPDAFRAIGDAVAAGMARFRDGDGYRVAMPALVGSGTRA
ncbi:MAG: methyltransferase domain-containing protein [Alphaproteobacteria bacterium]